MTYPNVSQISIDGIMKKELNKDNDDDVPAITLLFYIFCWRLKVVESEGIVATMWHLLSSFLVW